jgi:hypothetical protein
MAKRAPDELKSVRFELQEKERELFEQFSYLYAISSIIDSLSKMSWEQMYAWITVFEAVNLIKTPIPTVADAEEVPSALAAWAKTVKEKGGGFFSELFDFSDMP